MSLPEEQLISEFYMIEIRLGILQIDYSLSRKRDSLNYFFTERAIIEIIEGNDKNEDIVVFSFVPSFTEKDNDRNHEPLLKIFYTTYTNDLCRLLFSVSRKWM